MELKTYRKLPIKEIYDFIVVGGGASGLFFAASLNLNGHRGIIIESSKIPGKKLLATGGGRCNFTHDGSIKDFPYHYHSISKNITQFVRSPLYKFNNKSIVTFFENLGVDSYVQNDGRIFPLSNKASTIRDALLKKCEDNSWTFSLSSSVVNIEKIPEGFAVESSDGTIFFSKNLIIASGGPALLNPDCLNILDLLSKIGIKIIKPIPSLTPIKLSNFNISKLSGISFENAEIRIVPEQNCKTLYKKTGPLIITETGFSGPLVLNASGIINPLIDKGKAFSLEIYPDINIFKSKYDFSGVNLSLSNAIREFSNLPERYVKYYCGEFSHAKASSVPHKQIDSIISNMLRLQYSGSLILEPSFSDAMSSLGGVSLEEIDNKSFQCKSLKGLYVIGEALDISGDTGGYNLQFMWSSAHDAASHIMLSL